MEIGLGLVGAACMGWGGSAIQNTIGVGDRVDLAVPIFAVGVVLLGQLPSVALRARVRQLEARLGIAPGTSTSAS
jgi:hypothetical protein